MTHVLEVADVVKTFGKHRAVDGVSFQVRAGRIFGLLGPNGAGKSTTIRMIMNIIVPDSGSIRVFGERQDGNQNDRIGFLPEERGLYRKMTVRDHLLFLGEIRGVRKEKAGPRIDEWLERMGLVEWAGNKVEELSKGMQQKIQFIGTMLADPPILILDEPFSGLDPINVIQLKETLIHAREAGKAIIFSTHVLEQAEKLCDDICLIKDGRIILHGDLDRVREQFRLPLYRVRGTGLERLEGLPGVKSITREQREDEPDELSDATIEATREDTRRVELEDDSARAAFLTAALAAADLTEFRALEPDLESIFIEAVSHAAR